MVLVDDEIDTGGSIVQAVNLVEERAPAIYVAFVHPVFSADAVERLAALPVTEYITTDSIPIEREKRPALATDSPSSAWLPCWEK